VVPFIVAKNSVTKGDEAMVAYRNRLPDTNKNDSCKKTLLSTQHSARWIGKRLEEEDRGKGGRESGLSDKDEL
jgi:hypothetical protein